MSTTRLTIMQKMAQETGLGTLVTATSGSTTTLVDTTSVLTGPYSAQRFGRGWPVRYTTLNSAASTESSAVSSYDPSIGTITLSPATTASKAADVAQIWSGIDHIARVTEAIDRGLTRHCFRWVPIPLTDIPDGDMGDSGVTLWGTVSNAATTKVTQAWPVSFGQRYMFVNNSAANGYQPSAAIPCQAGDSWILDLLVYVASGTASIVAYDNTNAASITLSGDGSSYSGTGWKRLHNQFTIPTGCETWTLRLGGAELTADTYWTDVAAYPKNRRRFTLPARVLRKRVAAVLIRSGEEYEDFRLKPYVTGGREVSVQQSPVGITVELSSGSGDPPYVEELRPYEALSTDAATTECPEDLAVASSIYELYRPLAAQHRIIESKSGYVTDSEMQKRVMDAMQRMKSYQTEAAESKVVYR